MALYKRRSRNARIEVVRTGVHTRQMDREIAAERAPHAVEFALVEKISKISMMVQRIGHLQVVNANIKASQDQASLARQGVAEPTGTSDILYGVCLPFQPHPN